MLAGDEAEERDPRGGSCTGASPIAMFHLIVACVERISVSVCFVRLRLRPAEAPKETEKPKKQKRQTQNPRPVDRAAFLKRTVAGAATDDKQPEEKEPDAVEKKPDAEEKKPDEKKRKTKKPGPEENKPDAVEKKPDAQEKKPDEKKRKTASKKTEEKKPDAEEKKPDEKKRKTKKTEKKPDADEKKPDKKTDEKKRKRASKTEEKKPGVDDATDKNGDGEENEVRVAPRFRVCLMRRRRGRVELLGAWGCGTPTGSISTLRRRGFVKSTQRRRLAKSWRWLAPSQKLSIFLACFDL